MFDEPTINFIFGRVLRRQRRAWEKDGVVQVQPLRALQSKKRPDILIAEVGRDPVVIETEVAPANTVENDARMRLNARTNTGDTIYTAIAVCLPELWRRAANEAILEAAIKSTEVNWAIWSLEENGSSRRWPQEGWVRSGISLLAFAAYQSTLAHHRIRTASNALYEAVSATGKKLAHLEDAGYNHALRQIANILCQKPNEQTFGMAALILTNALVFHELLAGRGNLVHIPTLDVLKWYDSGVLRKEDVVDAWSQILSINYMPIFAVARDILIQIPDPFAQEIITNLDKAVMRAGLRTLLSTHDVFSETFQRMITDRKKLASFYTLPETAALLAGLALTSEQAPGGCAWSDTDGLKSVVVADFACGTGTLLSAAYRRIAWLHESAGGDSASLHSAWMENSLLGIDVLPAAAHLTARIASLGPLHRDINGREKDKNGRPRGPFDILPLASGEEPTYPVLWGHDATREVTLEFEPDCKAVPQPDADERKLVEVVTSRTHLHINLDWQFNSQPLQSQWTSRPAIGGRAWPSVCLYLNGKDIQRDQERKRLQSIALLLWLNSTPGVLIRWLWSNRQQHGRGMATREILATMPVLDVRQLSEEQLSQCENLFCQLRCKCFLPVHRLPDDRARADLDVGLLGNILGWPRGWFEVHGPLDLVRRKLAAEPSVHGHKRR